MPRGISNGLYLVRYACPDVDGYRIVEQYIKAQTVRQAVDYFDLESKGYTLIAVFRQVDYR